MLFAEALKLLQEGENVCREIWGTEQGYLTLLEGMSHIWKIILPPNTNAGNHILSVEELLADDWKKFVLPVIEAVSPVAPAEPAAAPTAPAAQ